MDDNSNSIRVYLKYNNGYVDAEIEDNNGRRNYDHSFKNVDNKDPHDFCSEVADKMESELAKNIKWSMIEENYELKNIDTPNNSDISKPNTDGSFKDKSVAKITLAIVLGIIISTVIIATTIGIVSYVNYHMNRRASVDRVLEELNSATSYTEY